MLKDLLQTQSEQRLAVWTEQNKKTDKEDEVGKEYRSYL